MKAEHKRRISTGVLTGTALLLALGVILPVVFHAFPLGGRIFLPMHIPTFIAGLVLGPAAGLVVGAGSPIASALLTGRPTFLYMVPMVFEMSAYGIVAGLMRPAFARMLRRAGPATTKAAGTPSETAGVARPSPFAAIPLALLCAMIAGRAVWIAVVVWLAPVIGLTARTFAAGLGALGAGWIGMVIQLAIIPPIVRGIERVRTIEQVSNS
jgi:hypothetical protein